MKKFAIRAYEDTYRGLHGIESKFVMLLEDRKEAEEYARDASISLMQDYDFIWSSFEREAIEEGYEEGTDGYYDWIEQCVEENVAYDIFEIIRETDESIERLDKKFWNNPDKFIEDYCK